MRILRTMASMAFGLLLTTGNANSQTNEDIARAHYKKQFADWGGIVFRCLPDDSTDDLQKQLCAAAGTEARFLAATSKTPFRDATGDEPFMVFLTQNELNNALLLEALIIATKGGHPRAVHMSLRAGSFYSNAIEKDARADDPESKPRSGDLILWERTIIGSGGTEHELAQGLSNSFSTVLKDFFGVFVESRN